MHLVHKRMHLVHERMHLVHRREQLVHERVFSVHHMFLDDQRMSVSLLAFMRRAERLTRYGMREVQ